MRLFNLCALMFKCMKASDDPRNGGAEMKADARHIRLPPKQSMSAKSAVRPRKEPSSKSRQSA